MASVHSRRSTDIRVNLTLTSSDASRGGHVTKAPTPSHVVPRRRAPIRAQVIEIPPAKKKRERSALSRAAVSTIDYAHEIQRGVDGLASLHTVITENGSNKDTTFNCSICRENYSVLDDLFQCCSNVQCDTLVCRPCMLTYIDGLVHGSPYTMPPIKCCGCRQTIPTHIWRNALTYRCCEVKSPFLCYRDSIYAAVNAVNSKLRAAMAAHDEEEEDVITLASIFKLPDNFENLSADTALLHRIPSKVFAFQSSTSAVVEIEFMTDAEKTLHNNRVESLSNKYNEGGKAMFSLRCRGCDSTFSLYVPAHDDMTKNKIAAQRWIRDTLTFVCGSVPKKKFELIQCMIAYATGQIPAKEFVDKVDIINERLQDTPAMRDGQKFRMIISCIIDTEKRAAARFAQLRKHPFFKNSCCQQKMCFNCKVASYHRGISCASKLRAESAIGVQSCPNCSVPTIRSEGCDSIICPCGTPWRWSN